MKMTVNIKGFTGFAMGKNVVAEGVDKVDGVDLMDIVDNMDMVMKYAWRRRRIHRETFKENLSCAIGVVNKLRIACRASIC